MFGISPFGVWPEADDEEARWLLLRGTGDLGHVDDHALEGTTGYVSLLYMRLAYV